MTKDLSLTQKYFACAFYKKGKLNGFDLYSLVCLLASGILELQLSGCISMEGGKRLHLPASGRKVAVTSGLPMEKAHLRPLYDYLNQDKPLKLEKVLIDYHYTLSSGKRRNALINAIGESLVWKGLANEGKAALFGGRKSWYPAKKAVNQVIGMIRSELLEKGGVTEDTAALAILLKRGKIINQYFSRYERKEMKENLNIFSNSPEGILVKEMVTWVNAVIDATTILATMGS